VVRFRAKRHASVEGEDGAVKLLKRYRKMRIGETRQRGDQCIYLGKWFDIAGTVGQTIRPGDAGRFRTKRRLPMFCAK